MKVLAIFALVQIVGTLGGPVVSEQNRMGDEESAIIEIFQEIITDVSLRPFMEYTLNSTELGEVKCRMNGGPGAHDAYIESIQNYLTSLVVLMNETQIQLEKAANLQHGRVDFAVETVCHWVTTAESLSRPSEEALKLCLSPEERTSVDLLSNMSTAGLQYLCQNKGSHILAFLAADGINCVNSSKIAIRNCMDSFNRNISIISEPSMPAAPPFSIPIITLNTEACTEFETLQHCVVGVLQRCANPTPSYEINSIINIFKKTSGCEDILKANITPTPSNSEEV